MDKKHFGLGTKYLQSVWTNIKKPNIDTCRLKLQKAVLVPKFLVLSCLKIATD